MCDIGALVVVVNSTPQPHLPEAQALGEGGEAASPKRGAHRGLVRGTVFQRGTAAAAKIYVTVAVEHGPAAAGVRVVILVTGEGNRLGRLREAGERAPIPADIRCAASAFGGDSGHHVAIAAGVGRGGAGDTPVREG